MSGAGERAAAATGGAGGPARREVAAAVVIHDGRVLAQTRPEGRGWSGWWEFPGGKLEPGEDAAACAVRECREELGLDVRVVRPLQTVDWHDERHAVRVAFLLCAPGDDGAPARAQAREGQRVLWARAEDLPSLRFLPANADVVARIGRMLPGGPVGGAPAGA